MPASRNTMISFLSKNKNANFSIELNKLIMDPVEVQSYIDSFASIVIPSSKQTQSFVKLFHKSDSKSMDVKTKTFGTNKVILVNEAKTTFSIDKTIVLNAIKVEPIQSVPQTAEYVEMTTRLSFSLINYSGWILQVDLTKTLNNPLEFGTKLPSMKADLVDVPFESMSNGAFDYVMTTLVQIDDSPIVPSDIMELIADVSSSTSAESVDDQYQSMIYSLAKDILKDPVKISQFKRQSGFKRLVSNTVELSRPMYYKQVLPVIDTFYITDKMDGVRAMLVIDEIYRRSGHRRIHIGTNIQAISDQVYNISSFEKPSQSKTIETSHTVLDVEMMVDNKGNRSFYCFDVIAFESERLSGAPFMVRFAKFDKVKSLLEKYELGQVKEFVKLTKEGFSSQIKEFYEKKRNYHIDGLVFTPEGLHHKEAISVKKSKFDRIINTGYANTISFKWKPRDQLTIDFYLMAHPSKKGSYILCSGVDQSTFTRLQMNWFDGYKLPATNNSHRYFPIQFESYDGKFDYVWTPSKEELSICSDDVECNGLDGVVGEFKFASDASNGYKLLDKPLLTRLRLDRVRDVAKGEYYGNNLRYAELIYHSVQYPLTIELLCSGNVQGYFAESDEWYKAQRAFNSFVKTHLMETYLYPKTEKSRIMDIACGHGQDLARSIELGFDEIIMLDRDVDALYDLLDRKYDLRIRRKGASAKVHIRRMDLEESSEANIEALKLPAQSADHAMINFALHYICHSAPPGEKDHLTEFAKFCGHFLKQGGNLMITTFHGQKMFDMLKNTPEWSSFENNRMKYSIKKAYTSDAITSIDQAIDVLLPFSAGSYYREYLVNYDYVQQVFEQNGFKMIASDTFDSLLRTYKKQNKNGYSNLSAGDQEYVSLYGYMILEKQ